MSTTYRACVALLVCICASGLRGQGVSPYKGYTVYRVKVNNAQEAEKILSVRDFEGIDFWTEVNLAERKVDVMASPRVKLSFENFLNRNHFHWWILIDDVGALGYQAQPSTKSAMRAGGDDLTSRYLSYGEIVDYFKSLPQFLNPYSRKPLVELESIGKSYEKRSMYMAKISSDHSRNKPIVFVEAGTHAREWAGPAFAVYLVQQLVENFTLNRDILRDVDFYVVPVTNPDGYEYSRNEDRMWRKTRSEQKECVGVDGNRNYRYHWGEIGASKDECSDTYMGPKPFSEDEIVNIKNVGIKYRNRLLSYIAVHSYGSFLLFPWGYTRDPPEDWWKLNHCGVEGARAIEKYSGTKYTVGSSAAVLYEAAGGSDDWFKGALDVPFTYTFELPGRSFHLAEELLEETGRETLEGVRAMVKCFVKFKDEEQPPARLRSTYYDYTFGADYLVE